MIILRFKTEYNILRKQFLLIGDKFLAGVDNFLCDVRQDNGKVEIFCRGKLNKYDELMLLDRNLPGLIVALFISDFV